MKRTPFPENRCFMKKRTIAVVLIILLVIALVVVGAIHISKAKNSDSQPASVPFQNAQIGVTVDGWLKIIQIDEYYGKLAVVTENVSEEDVEYAVLTVKTKNGELTFNVSALLRGTKAVLLCNEQVASDPGEVYTAWQTKDKVVFENMPVMNEDKIEVSVADGSISVKNISGEDTKSDIVIYYKDKKDDLVNGSVTYKIRVNALKEGSQTFIKAPELNENNCRIIFTDYVD